MISLQDVEARLNFLLVQREQQQQHVVQAQANLNAFDGAIAECRWLINELKNEEENKE